MSTFVFQSIFKPIIFWNSLLPEKLLEPFIQQAGIDTYSEQASKNSLYQNRKVFFISVCRNACSEITYSITLTPSRREPQLKKDKDGAIEQLKCVYHRVCKLQPGFFAQRRPLRSLIQSPFTLILDPILTSLTLPFPRQQKIRGSKQEGKVLLEAGTPVTVRMSSNRKCWRETENKSSHSKYVTIWSDLAWTQGTTTSCVLEAMKAEECSVTMDIQGNDPQKVKLHFCLTRQGST